MDCTTTIAFEQTGYFSKIATDYVAGAEGLKPFYEHEVSFNGLEDAMSARLKYATDRNLLVTALKEQYEAVTANAMVNANIESLLQNNTLTVVTAHQPNIFTGYLYFVYKILHAIKLSEALKQQYPQYNFVPVYYMGSEDADLDELGNVNIEGNKLVWHTSQTGAVGRMKVDKELLQLLNTIEGQLGIHPHGAAVMQMLRNAYTSGTDIQTATFRLVHELFAQYGLVVLIPDNAILKRAMQAVFKDDLLHQTASGIVEKTIAALGENYKVQATPRDINLFYLYGNIRNRIVLQNGQYYIQGTDMSFSQESLLHELEQYPERFSPNVILRGLFQETILPNIAFIGGGGELAYWLELKALFKHYNTPYPVLMLRNSILWVENKYEHSIKKIGFTIDDFFKNENDLLNTVVHNNSSAQLQLSGEVEESKEFYERLKKIAGRIDATLLQHISALQTKQANQLHNLEKKMLRAEKRKFESQKRQLSLIKSALFPNNNLQERVENFLPYYAKYGKGYIDSIYDNVQPLGKDFIIILNNTAVAKTVK